ncbi:MAG: ferredoxin reductase [Candidatus Binatia bacterium]
MQIAETASPFGLHAADERAPETGPAAPQPTLRSRLTGAADLLAWPLRLSHYLELLNPLWSTHTTWARVVEVIDEAPDARTLVLRPGRGFAEHRAGQYVPVTVTIDGRRHVRTYSISSAPGRAPRAGCIAITVKHVPGGRVSEHLVRRVARGEYVALGAPLGDFVLPDASRPRLLLLTAGSGVTPVRAMLQELAASARLVDVVHLHWAPRPADVIFTRELQDLVAGHPGYRLQLLTTRDGAAVSSNATHFTEALLEERCPDWRARDAFACGPRALLDAAAKHWIASGLGERLRIERFQPVLAPATGDVAGGRVCLRRSGVTIDAAAGQSLLHAAEAAGLAPAHGCRMGICHTCTVTLRSGRVRDLRDGRITDEPGARVQICVSAAAGECEVEL